MTDLYQKHNFYQLMVLWHALYEISVTLKIVLLSF